MANYYTYILINSLDGQPFYVGKGSGSRMYQHIKEAQREDYTKRSVHNKILSILEKGGKVLYKKYDQPTEEAAFEEEKRLILEYGRKDLETGILCNLTDGGEGQQQSPESVAKRAERHRGMKRSDESKQRMKEAQREIIERNIEKYGSKKDPEAEKKRVAKRTGVPWSENARSVKRNKPTARPVIVHRKDSNEYVGEWESVSLCAKELGCDTTTVWKICEGTYGSIGGKEGKVYPLRSHKGYTFMYKEKEG